MWREVRWQGPPEFFTTILHPRSKFRSFVFIIVLFAISFWFVGSLRFRLPYIAKYQSNSSSVFNSTLGFAQIFAIVLPGSDRRDPLLAAGNAASIDITVFDALLPEQITHDETPKNWGNNDYKPVPGVLGCLMSHVSIWRKIIKENISSALIMESDADFDLRIKQSMLGLSEGSKAIADFPFSPASHTPTGSPYGDNWDILWIGHCGANTNGDGRAFTYKDDSAADAAHVWAPYAKLAENYQRADGTRLVFQLRDVVCTVAYAISNQGAHKMEKRFENVNQPVDLEMLRQCTEDPELVCLASFPQIISMVEALPSSIDKEEGEKKKIGGPSEQDSIVGQGIQISARKNAALGSAGRQPKNWVKEWNDPTT